MGIEEKRGEGDGDGAEYLSLNMKRIKRFSDRDSRTLH